MLKSLKKSCKTENTYFHKITKFLANSNMIKSKIKLGKQKLKEDANINRSPTSYLRNPEEERNKYVQVLIDFKTLTSFFLKVLI